MATVQMYVSHNCPYCLWAEKLLKQKGVTAEKIFVDNLSGDDMQKIYELTGRHTVPQIFIGTHHVGGYDDLVALNRKGELDPLLAAP